MTVDSIRGRLIECAAVVERHLDTFVLLLVFFVMVAVAVHMSHDMMDKDSMSWAREEIGTILGALVMRRAQSSKPNGNGTP